MSEENVERVRTGYEAWNRCDFDRALEAFDPEIEWTFAGGARFPGTDTIYRGHEGLRQFWDAFLEPWEHFEIEVEDLRDAGEQVVALVRFRAMGSGSGLEIDTAFAHVVTFRGPRVIQFEAFLDRDAALEAAGLRA